MKAFETKHTCYEASSILIDTPPKEKCMSYVVHDV